MTIKHSTFIAGVGIAAVVALAGCTATPETNAPSGDAEFDGQYRVVLIAGQSGVGAATAKDATIGLEVAAETINAAGGIQGKEVIVEVLDSKSDPTQAVSQLQGLVNSGEPVDLVFNGINSSEALAMMPILTENKILSMSNGTSNELNQPDLYPYHFGMSPANTDTLAVLAPEIEGVKKFAILVPSTAFGDSLATAMTEIAEGAGADVVAVERFDPADVDYTVQYQRVLAANPDLIFTDATGSDVIGRIFEARRTAGGLEVPVLAGTGVAAVVPTTVADTETLEECVMPAYAFTVTGKADQELIAPLAKRVQADSDTGSVYVPGIAFDILRTAALAAETAKSTSGEDMAAALQSLEIPSDYELLFPEGFAYSAKTHFPQIIGDAISLIPCGSTTENGFWVTE